MSLGSMSGMMRSSQARVMKATCSSLVGVVMSFIK